VIMGHLDSGGTGLPEYRTCGLRLPLWRRVAAIEEPRCTKPASSSGRPAQPRLRSRVNYSAAINLRGFFLPCSDLSRVFVWPRAGKRGPSAGFAVYSWPQRMQ